MPQTLKIRHRLLSSQPSLNPLLHLLKTEFHRSRTNVLLEARFLVIKLGTIEVAGTASTCGL